MKVNETIQKIGAILLLLLFTFSITPKRFLHDAIADHRHVWQVPVKDKTEVQKSTFHCFCDHLVAESPFTFTDVKAELSPLYFNSLFYLADYTSNLSGILLLKESRGSPSVY